MLHTVLRIVGTGLALLFIAHLPCIAQTAPLLPQESGLPPQPVDNRFPDRPPMQPMDNFVPDQPRMQPVEENGSFPAQLWELLATPPPTRGGFYQSAGFGFNQSPVLAPSYRVTWFPEANISSQAAELSGVRQEFRVICPVYHDECQTFGLTAGVRNVLYDTHAIIPGTGQAFPEQLWDVRFGFNYKYLFSNGWSTGITADFGSASDFPFANVNQLTGGLSTFLRIPVGEHNAWLFTLSYSPTGELNFPIPGVAFYWQPNDSFNATIGVPAKVVWRPVEDVILEASYMPLTTVRAKAIWRVWGGISVYTGYDKGNESYFLTDSPDIHDRFFYYDQRVIGGVRLQFGPHCALDFSSGYAFDRYYFEGTPSNDQHNGRIDVADGPFLSFMAEIRY